MSDAPDPHQYDALKEAHEQIVQEEEKRKAKEQAKEQNSPEFRLAAIERELDEMVRTGRVTRPEMAYQLRRFENQLVVEINIEDLRRARDEELALGTSPQRDEKEAGERESQVDGAREADDIEQQADGRAEMTEARSARLARLRTITENLARERENDDAAPFREAGGHAR